MDRRLERAGLRARDCHAVGVELRPVWGTHLPALAPQVQRRYGTATLPTFHQPYAASTCDGARLGTTNPNPNPSSNPNPDPNPNPNSDQVEAALEKYEEDMLAELERMMAAERGEGAK